MSFRPPFASGPSPRATQKQWRQLVVAKSVPPADALSRQQPQNHMAESSDFFATDSDMTFSLAETSGILNPAPPIFFSFFFITVVKTWSRNLKLGQFKKEKLNEQYVET